MILACYDGSDDARAAIDHAARLMPGSPVTVLTVWAPERDYDGQLGPGLGLAGVYARAPEVDAAREQAAREHAEEGAERATAAGLVAEPRTSPQRNGIARAVLEVAAEIDADVVVLGTRGRGGVMSFLLGSVSHAVLQEADRAVLVVPAPTVAEQRRGIARAVGAGPDAS